MFGTLKYHRMIIFMNLFEIAESLWNVPKFSQILNWWRHSALGIHFQTMAPIFLTYLPFLLKNASIDLLDIKSHKNCLASPRWCFKENYHWFWLTLCDPMTSYTAGKFQFVFERAEKWWTSHNFVKTYYFLMRFFVRSDSWRRFCFANWKKGKFCWLSSFKKGVDAELDQPIARARQNFQKAITFDPDIYPDRTRFGEVADILGKVNTSRIATPPSNSSKLLTF